MSIYGSKAWKAEQRKLKLLAAKERQKKLEIKNAADALKKVLLHFPLSDYTKGLNRRRAEILRQAHDVLASAVS